MSTKNDGGPAFPISIPGVGDNGMGGMALRDWFAGQALAGMVTGLCLSPDAAAAIAAQATGHRNSMSEAMARVCLDYADAMLKAREA